IVGPGGGVGLLLNGGADSLSGWGIGGLAAPELAAVVGCPVSRAGIDVATVDPTFAPPLAGSPACAVELFSLFVFWRLLASSLASICRSGYSEFSTSRLLVGECMLASHSVLTSRNATATSQGRLDSTKVGCAVWLGTSIVPGDWL